MKSITHFLIIISLIVLFENNSKANEFITIIVEDIALNFFEKTEAKKEISNTNTLSDTFFIENLTSNKIEYIEENLIEDSNKVKIKINSAESIFNEAMDLKNIGKPIEGIKVLSELIIHHPTNSNFIGKSELLCAELYLDANMFNTAQAVINQILSIYEDKEIISKADKINHKIKLNEKKFLEEKELKNE